MSLCRGSARIFSFFFVEMVVRGFGVIFCFAHYLHPPEENYCAPQIITSESIRSFKSCVLHYESAVTV